MTSKAIGPVLVGCALLLTSWLLLTHVGFWKRGQQADTYVYQGYGRNMLDGQVPYRDFPVEYPPAALPTFILPEIGHPTAATYRFRFEWLMALLGGVALVCVDVALRALRAADTTRLGVEAVIGVSPLILGPLVLSRFDLWPAALSVAALAAFLRNRYRLGGGTLGLAAAAKFYPAAILPVALAYVWQREGRATALRSLATFAGVLAVCLLPFAILAPHGFLHPFVSELRRPLEVESLGGALLMAAHHLLGVKVGLLISYGSENFGGAGGRAAEVLTTVLEIAALVSLWVVCARRRIEGAELVAGAAAAVSLLLAFGKVFSPQYLIWLLPLVPLVEPRLRRSALPLLVVACALTQSWYPRRAAALAVHFRQPESWLLLARDLAVVALAAVLVRSLAVGPVQSEP